MIRSIGLVAAAVLFGGAQNGSGPLLGVTQIVKSCDSYKGHTVRAAGYLKDCAGYDCQLYADKATVSVFADAWKEMKSTRRDSADWPKAWNRLEAVAPISIGGENEVFERKAAPLQHSYVVITGRVAKDSCTGFATGLDRTSGIAPTDIRPWTPAEGAPSNPR